MYLPPNFCQISLKFLSGGSEEIEKFNFQQSSAAGAIGSASAYGVGGSRFEPWVVQILFVEEAVSQLGRNFAKIPKF